MSTTASPARSASRRTTLRRIVLPAALHRALAASGIEEIFIVWDTSLAMLVTIADLTGVAKYINATRHITFKA